MIKFLSIFLMSMLPLVEQKGAIIYGINVYDLNPIPVFIICFLGSLIPFPLIYFSFNTLIKFISKYKALKIINKYIDSKIRKGTEKVQKYQELALILFVAIPLPTTGVWTGSLLASFFNLNFTKSLISIVVGAFISSVLITLGSIYIPNLFNV